MTQSQIVLAAVLAAALATAIGHPAPMDVFPPTGI